MKEWTEEMSKRMSDYLDALERLRLPEYLRYLDDRKRFIRTQVTAGILRGIGMAIGFTILGAVIVLVLQRLAQQNLPLIGDFLVQVVELVQKRLE